VIFLAVSGALLVGLLWWVYDVLLPFVLAVIIAYVLTPLVALCERVRVPRSLAILLVYAVTFTIIYVSIAAIAPRIYDETVKLARDTPALAQNLAQRWGPRIERWGQVFLDRSRPAPAYSDQDQPAFEIRKQADGSYAVELGSGLDVIQEGPKRWRVMAQEKSPDKFRVSELAAEGIDRAVRYVSLNVLELLKFGQTVVSRVARGVFLLFMTLMVAGYIMHTRETILDFLRSLPAPRARLSFERLLWRMDRGLAGVVRGQLLICLVNGVLSAIGFWMFGLKYWPILAIIAGVMSLIPIFGSILSSIPAVLIGLTQDFWTALWVLLWIIGIHQVEANLLNPKIIGVAAKIHPVLVVFALIIGEHVYGLWGALLAVPALSLTQSVFNHFRFESMPDLPPDSIAPPAVGTPVSS
jgi:predicted PurR-regulated permease PerM